MSTDQLERARELMETIKQASDELVTLYGPLWHERDALRRQYETPMPGIARPPRPRLQNEGEGR